MKFYKTLEIPIKDSKENTTNIFSEKLEKDSIYLSWNHKKSIKNNKDTVIIEIVENEEDSRFDCVNEFIKIIQANKIIIDKYKLTESNIALFINYEYDEQCNMEFSIDELKKLVDYEIVLCISCWQNNSSM
jgi:hypothetical protein